MNLSQALNRLPAAKYRQLLREAVGQRMDRPRDLEILKAARELTSLAAIKGILASTYTYAYLRDRLPVAILIALVCDEVSWTDVLNAFKEPATYCRMERGEYVFCWPAKYDTRTAASVLRSVKRGSYDADVQKRHGSTFFPAVGPGLPAAATPSTTTTEKTVNLTDLTIDDIYETFVTLAATKYSILRTQLDADGIEMDESSKLKMLTNSVATAIRLIEKHFSQDTAKAVSDLYKLDTKADITTFAGTENEKAAFAVKKIVSENAEAFKLDTRDASTPAEEVILNVKPEMKQLLDLALSQASAGAFASTDELIGKVKRVHDSAVRKDEEIARLKRLIAAKPAIAIKSAAITSTTGAALPSGTVITVRADDIFLSPEGKKSKYLGFDIPAFDWGGADHPYVPMLNPHYIFKPLILAKFLWALIANKKGWLHGHTGVGKTEFVAQVCARLRWPFFRVNMDSEITRMDLIGRDVLIGDGKGGTISKFVEGILPQAMTSQGHGGVLCVDEISFGRPDVMYVFQRVLEDKGLLLTEDGGRLVHPGDMFRIVATDNTRGQGDEFGAYAGARPQSAAFLDRFTAWIEFDYLAPKEEARLLMNGVAGLAASDAEQIAAFASEVRTAFKTGSIYQTISPRGSMALAEFFLFSLNIMAGDRNAAVKMAVETTMLAKASDNDRQIIKGLYDRTFK